MSIRGLVQELELIRQEIKTLNGRRKKLREKEQEVEQQIQDYLRSKNQPGLKYEGTAILLEEKEKRANKKAKERDADCVSVLQRYGIENPSVVLQELLEARKGDPVPCSKIKFKKYKK